MVKKKREQAWVTRITFSWLERSHKKTTQEEYFTFPVSPLSPRARLLSGTSWSTPRRIRDKEQIDSLSLMYSNGLLGPGSGCGRKEMALSTPTLTQKSTCLNSRCGPRKARALPGENRLKTEMWQLDAKQDPKLGDSLPRAVSGQLATCDDGPMDRASDGC